MFTTRLISGIVLVAAALVVGAIAYVIIYTIIGGRRDRRMAAAGKEVPCGEHTDP